MLNVRTIISVIFSLITWQFLSTYVFNIKLIPPPTVIFMEAWAMTSSLELPLNIIVSLKRILLGFAVGSLMGIIIGSAIAMNKFISDLLKPPLELLSSIPPISLIPLALLWFGIGETSGYSLIIYLAVIIVSLSTIDGVNNIPEIHKRVAECLGARGTKIFTRVILPSTFPHLLAGLRVSLGFSFQVVVAAEMLGASSGIGHLIIQSHYFAEMRPMLVGILALGIIGISFDRLFQLMIAKSLPRFDVEKRVR